MTVRIVRAWSTAAKSPEDRPSAVILADDADRSVQMLRPGYDRQQIIDGTYTVPVPPEDKMQPYLDRANGDLLNALVGIGLTNTMYLTKDSSDFDSREAAVDYVFSEVW